jgi:hypothetical protein
MAKKLEWLSIGIVLGSKSNTIPLVVIPQAELPVLWCLQGSTMRTEMGKCLTVATEISNIVS